MPPKSNLINCSGCLLRHPRPSCLRRRAVTTTPSGGYKVGMAHSFSPEEMVTIFGDDGEKGLVPPRDSPDYLPYLEKVLAVKQAEIDARIKDTKVHELERKLRRLSVSTPAGTGASTHSPSSGDVATSVISTIPDLSKLRPESYCSPVKSFDKLTFRELVRGCVKVLNYLQLFNVEVEGYLSHLSFIMDKSAMSGVYTTEGLVLYERSVTSKVLEGTFLDWPEVDPASDSRYLSYEYTFDHMSRADSSKPDRNTRFRKKSGKKSNSPIYDFDCWGAKSGDICWMWNCKSCQGCERRHGVCGLCHGAHKAVECEKHLAALVKPDSPESSH